MGAAPQWPSYTRSLAAISIILFMTLVSATLTASTSLRTTSAGDLRRCDNMLLPAPAAGPESIAFDGTGGGPYTGVSDGRVLRWRPETRLWEEFAVPPWPQDR